MAEYIEREAAIKAIDHEVSLDGLYANIKAIPAADVRPERHGEWKHVSDDDQYEGCYFCSECKEEFYYLGDNDDMLPNFCPNCGAKMYGSGKSDNWISTSEQLPPENQIVDTKIDDEKGIRNEQELVYSHNLWFLPDKSMYVYYTPTHWRCKERLDGKEDKRNG